MKVKLLLGRELTMVEYLKKHPELKEVEFTLILAEGIFSEGDKYNDFKGLDMALEILSDTQNEFPVIVYSAMVENYFLMDQSIDGVGVKMRKLLECKKFGFVGGQLIPEKIFLKYKDIISRK